MKLVCLSSVILEILAEGSSDEEGSGDESGSDSSSDDDEEEEGKLIDYI